MTLPPEHDLRFSIIAGNPTAEELAAVTAVLVSMVEEDQSAGAEDAAPAVSAWQRAQRPIRGPIAPAQGAWRGFTGRR